MQIGGLQKLTLIDYPGKVACTVFCVGCNFRCPWCYNPELVLPEKIKKQPIILEENFFKFLKSRKGLIEGVVISGGEPTIHKDLPKFCKKIKVLGYLIKLDTNGSNPEVLKKLIKNKLIDYVAMDIKAPLGLKSEIRNPKSETKSKIADFVCERKASNYKIEHPAPSFALVRGQISKYEKAAGKKIDLKKIKKSIEIIKKSKIDYEFRMTVVPAIHAREDIIKIAKDISPANKFYLQNFLPEKTVNPKFKKIKPYQEEYLLEIQEAISPFFEVCEVR